MFFHLSVSWAIIVGLSIDCPEIEQSLLGFYLSLPIIIQDKLGWVKLPMNLPYDWDNKVPLGIYFGLGSLGFDS